MFDLAAAAWIFWPVREEPVKLRQRMDIWEARAEPEGVPWPDMMLTTPDGKPALANNLAA
jgi:hypothetical protein